MVSSQISLGGGGVQANNYMLDGVPITDMRGFPVLNPTMEAIDDIKVQVHTFDAEMGRTGGGVFNTTARSGANVFHGSGVLSDRPVWGSVAGVFCREARRDQGEQRAVRVVLSPRTAAASAGRSSRTARSSGPPTEGYRDQVIQGLTPHVAERPAAHRRFFDDDAQRGAGPHLQPVLPRRRRQRAMSGDRHRLARDRRRVHRRDHSRGRIPRPIPVAFKMASYWPLPDTQQRGQPAERQHHGQPAGLRRHVDVQGRAQVHRPLVAERPVHLQPDQGAGGVAGPRRALVPGAGRQLAGPTSQGVRR